MTSYDRRTISRDYNLRLRAAQQDRDWRKQFFETVKGLELTSVGLYCPTSILGNGRERLYLQPRTRYFYVKDVITKEEFNKVYQKSPRFTHFRRDGKKILSLILNLNLIEVNLSKEREVIFGRELVNLEELLK